MQTGTKSLPSKDRVEYFSKCLMDSRWLVLNSTDPAQQLQWLVEVLKNAEEKNEKVHILAHIPPGQNDCMDVWKDNYYKIITRYSNIEARGQKRNRHWGRNRS